MTYTILGTDDENRRASVTVSSGVVVIDIPTPTLVVRDDSVFEVVAITD